MSKDYIIEYKGRKILEGWKVTALVIAVPWAILLMGVALGYAIGISQ